MHRGQQVRQFFGVREEGAVVAREFDDVVASLGDLALYLGSDGLVALAHDVGGRHGDVLRGPRGAEAREGLRGDLVDGPPTRRLVAVTVEGERGRTVVEYEQSVLAADRRIEGRAEALFARLLGDVRGGLAHPRDEGGHVDDADQLLDLGRGFGHDGTAVTMPDQHYRTAAAYESLQGVHVGDQVHRGVECFAARQVEGGPRKASSAQGLSQARPTPGSVPGAVDEDEGRGIGHFLEATGAPVFSSSVVVTAPEEVR